MSFEHDSFPRNMYYYNNHPLAEELRQELIILLQKILSKYKSELLPIIPELCSMISKLITDPCPEVKLKLSEFISDLTSTLGKVMGPHTKGILIGLCGNLKHAHNKIRKISLTVGLSYYF